MGIPASPLASRHSGPRTDGNPSCRRYAAVLLAAIAIAVVLRVFVLHAYRIPSGSMEKTLLAGDFLIAERITYGSAVELPWSRDTGFRLPPLRTPRRGAVVIFRGWANDGEYIKRCVGLAGDTVEVRDNVLFVNGRRFDQTLTSGRGDNRETSRVMHRHQTGSMGYFGPHVVADGHIFVMGDNRDNPHDSRVNGDVPLDRLRGRALFIYWSVDGRIAWWNPLDRIRWRRLGRAIR
jgi:signal peptidase I